MAEAALFLIVAIKNELAYNCEHVITPVSNYSLVMNRIAFI
jgi:hypothetical protein